MIKVDYKPEILDNSDYCIDKETICDYFPIMGSACRLFPKKVLEYDETVRRNRYRVERYKKCIQCKEAHKAARKKAKPKSVEFKCPICGSQFFRTVDMKNMIRQCRGNHIPKSRQKGRLKTNEQYEGCSFEWDSKDDHKYFHDRDSLSEIIFDNKD